MLAQASLPVCPASSVLCGDTLCIPKQVLPSLTTTFRLCGESCTYASDACKGACSQGYMNCDGKCLLEEYYWRCGDQCLHKSEPCQGTCPNTFHNCGDKCRLLENNPYWKLCGDQCIFRDEPCAGSCPPDLFKCGEKCETQELLKHFAWRGCGSKCVPPVTACQGSCPSGYQLQDEEYCVKMESGP